MCVCVLVGGGGAGGRGGRGGGLVAVVSGLMNRQRPRSVHSGLRLAGYCVIVPNAVDGKFKSES